MALGACGSLFSGFLLAAAAVFARAGQDPVVGTAVLFALTAVAGADVLLVLISRRLARRPLLRGAPDHLAHRLRRLGLTAQGASVLLGVAAFGAVLVGVLAHGGWLHARAVLWVAGGVLVVVLGLLRVPVYGPPRARAGRQGGGRDARGGRRAARMPRAPRARGASQEERAERVERAVPRSGPRTMRPAPVYAPRRQPEAVRSSPDSEVRRAGRSLSPQVNASLRVRNG